MNIPGATYGPYHNDVGYGKIAANTTLRYRTVKYIDPEDGDECLDYCIEIFTRPFWFGWFRKKCWEEAVQTNDLTMGLAFAASLLK